MYEGAILAECRIRTFIVKAVLRKTRESFPGKEAEVKIDDSENILMSKTAYLETQSMGLDGWEPRALIANTCDGTLLDDGPLAANCRRSGKTIFRLRKVHFN